MATTAFLSPSLITNVRRRHRTPNFALPSRQAPLALLSDTDEAVRAQLASKRIAVTGGTGLLGRAVVRELTAAGAKVTLLSRRPNAAAAAFGYRVRAVHYDAATGTLPPPALAAVRDSDAVVNLAGEPVDAGRWTPSRKRTLTDSRVSGTRALARALRGGKARLISASAVGYYGAGAGSAPLSEDASPGVDFLARLATDWERAALARGSEHASVLRFGVVLAPDGGAAPRMAAAFRLYAGGAPGGGAQWLSWVHVSDAARFIARAAAASDGVSGVYNVCSPHPVRLRDFCGELARVLSRPCWLPVPAVAIRALMGSEAAQLILAGQRVVPARAVEEGFKFRYGTVDAALADVFGKQVARAKVR